MTSEGPPTRRRLVLAAGQERSAARATVVHVVNLGDYPVDPESGDWEEQGQQVLAEERRAVEEALAAHPSGFVYEARYGSPVLALATAAEVHDALLVVVGRHGGVSGALRRLLQGSVSRRLPRRTTRPVLLVPRP